MITDALLALLATPIAWLVTLLPAWNVSAPSDYLAWAMPLRYLNFILPFTEIVNCMAIWSSVVGGLWLFKWGLKLIDWIADVIP